MNPARVFARLPALLPGIAWGRAPGLWIARDRSGEIIEVDERLAASIGGRRLSLPSLVARLTGCTARQAELLIHRAGASG